MSMRWSMSVGMVALVFVGIMGGCASSEPDLYRPDERFDQSAVANDSPYRSQRADSMVLSRIQRAAESINEASQRLLVLRQKQEDPVSVEEGPEHGPLSTRLNAESWIGRIELITQSVANEIGWDFVIRGTAPQAPIIVTVDVTNRKAFDLLQEVGIQAGERAGVVVDRKNQRIAVVYRGGNTVDSDRNTPPSE